MRIENQHNTIQHTIMDVMDRGYTIYTVNKGNTPGESYPGVRVESSFKFRPRNEPENNPSGVVDHELIFTPVEIRVTEHKGNIKEFIVPLVDRSETHIIDENIPQEFMNNAHNIIVMRGKMEGKITDQIKQYIDNQQ